MGLLNKKLNELLIFIFGIIVGLFLALLNKSDNLSYLKLSQINVTQTRGYFLVSILTANKFIDTRAKTIYETWAKGQKNVLFFTQSKPVKTALPTIFLPGTDDSYPPQKKSFTMFKILYENYLNSYEWFIRTDDDVYIKIDKLKQFLSQLDSKKALYIGQPGFEHSPLYPFCMGGPGVIISRETLKRVGPHLNYCYKNLIKTEHEDVEIGRCIQKFVNISCTLSYEMKNIFYQLFGKNQDPLLQSPHLNIFKRTISIHPLKQNDLFYKIHLNELKNKALFLSNQIYKLKNRKNLSSTIENAKFFDSLSFYDLGSERTKSGIEKNIKNLIYSLNEEISSQHTRTNSGFLQSVIKSGYFNIDPYENLQINFHNELKYRDNRKKVGYSIQNLVMEVPFLDFSMNKETVDETTTINFILGFCSRLESFKNFMNNFVKNILNLTKNVRLIVVVCDIHSKNIKQIINESNLININDILIILELKANFNRGLYLNQGAKLVSDNEILFFVDVDFLIYEEILNRVRINTRLNSQVYMPIIFSKFNSPNANLEHNSNLVISKNGEWRHFGFGVVCIYKNDFIKVKFNESIFGWGKEDVNFAERIMNLKNMKVFRAVDYSIIHLYHTNYCDIKLPNDQFQMCLKSKIRTLGLKNLKKYF